MRSIDTLVLPQVACVKCFALWVSSSKSLSNPGVVKSLSISELVITECSSNSHTEDGSVESLMQVNVEVVWLASSRSEEVRQAQCSSDGSECKGFDASRDLEVIINVKEVNSECLWVVLDELNVSNSMADRGIFFLDVVLVSLDVWAVSSHFNLIYI